ncbi:hypothetical protein E0H50_26230 [Kribbella sindirgiensis]|uniref:Uncharacterized protein n=1 Tax=Kribbella sindirgiensis TaxID=1124744 RepID=A0A4R0IA74_9ACTN|nr:hypothetical protein E0H50_26230 [Kribbella sindirgiensis]
MPAATSGRSRVVAVPPLIWPDCRNVRDLAGLPTTTGELQPGRLIRSDNLDQLTPPDAPLSNPSPSADSWTSAALGNARRGRPRTPTTPGGGTFRSGIRATRTCRTWTCSRCTES